MDINWPHRAFPHTQEIYFDNGERRVIRGITHVEQGKMAHIIVRGGDDHGGKEIIINPDRVLFTRIISGKGE